MKHPLSIAIPAVLGCAAIARAEPILSSWFTQNSTVCARVIQSGTLTTPVTVWPAAGVVNNNTGGAAQTLPVYADVQRIRYTATDVYINANGLASYTMGPWFTNGGGLFGFWPTDKDYQIRITRTPVPAGTKTRHPGGMIGMMVNGVAIYDLGDAFAFNQSATPTVPTSVTGTDGMGSTGVWSRDALAVEVVTFDPGFAHQPGNNGQYHYHAEPKALRYQLGDNMKRTLNAGTTATFTYTEDTSNLHHSPILGWCYDGYPIYGPYAYDSGVAAISAGQVVSVALSNAPAANQTTPVVKFTGGGGSGAAATAVVVNGVITGITVTNGGTGYISPPTVTIVGTSRRIRTGFVLRDGTNGTQTLNTTGRNTLPKWAAVVWGVANPTNANPATLAATQWGPATNYTSTGGPGGTQTYLLGRYSGDYDFRGDLGQTQGNTFDLDQYNGRDCVTPEFPQGTYAYFVTIDASRNTAFPHMLGKQYYGTPNAGNAATVPADAVELFNGGPNSQETMLASSINSGNGNVTLTWSSVEGGTYKVEASGNLQTWTTLNAAVPGTANATQTSATETGAANTNSRRFYRATRTATATYDP